MLQALIKESFLNNLNAVVIKPSYPCAIVCPSPLLSHLPPATKVIDWNHSDSYTLQVDNGNLALRSKRFS